uniref:HTH cro/C1-type domain-containing protein n=3 Tax=Telluraves TaxID=3073808 RepID=A0A8B9G843_9PSIT
MRGGCSLRDGSATLSACTAPDPASRGRALGCAAERRARPRAGSYRCHGGERLGHGHGAAQEGAERGPGQVQAGQRVAGDGGVAAGEAKPGPAYTGGQARASRRPGPAPAAERSPRPLSSPQAILAAQRRGEDVETSKKWAAGQNKQHFITKNTAKLDRETEELHHDRVPLEVGKVIQQGRQSKGMTQKDLATKINEKPQVIADYESGRAIPNNQVMGKIERAIRLKLRGKDIGKPLETGPKGK